jgi:hypothetical protein
VRVHAEILKRQKLPRAVVGKEIWDERLADIASSANIALPRAIAVGGYVSTPH